MSNIWHPGYKDDPRSFWEKTNPDYAHVGPDFNHQQVWADWKRVFLGRFDWAGKHVIDYGCGGGWLGKLLFAEYGIAGYWGVDISQRSLEFAQQNVGQGEYMNPERFMHLSSQMVARWRSDDAIFVCLNLLHHMPTVEHVTHVLAAAGQAYVDHCVFTIRNNGKPAQFQPNNPGNAFWTTPEHMSELMVDEWEPEWKTKPEPYPALRQYLGFRRKE